VVSIRDRFNSFRQSPHLNSKSLSPARRSLGGVVRRKCRWEGEGPYFYSRSWSLSKQDPVLIVFDAVGTEALKKQRVCC